VSSSRRRSSAVRRLYVFGSGGPRHQRRALHHSGRGNTRGNIHPVRCVHFADGTSQFGRFGRSWKDLHELSKVEGLVDRRVRGGSSPLGRMGKPRESGLFDGSGAAAGFRPMLDVLLSRDKHVPSVPRAVSSADGVRRLPLCAGATAACSTLVLVVLRQRVRVSPTGERDGRSWVPGYLPVAVPRRSVGPWNRRRDWQSGSAGV
jgi:hypothetical protein